MKLSKSMYSRLSLLNFFQFHLADKTREHITLKRKRSCNIKLQDLTFLDGLPRLSRVTALNSSCFAGLFCTGVHLKELLGHENIKTTQIHSHS